MLLLIAAMGPAGSEVRATLARTHLPSAGSEAKATLARSKPTPYARDGGSNVSAPRQHYLQVDRHWTPYSKAQPVYYSKASTLSWFDRVSTLEKGVDVLTCGIEKNGITLLTRIIAEVMGRKFEWFPANPSTVGLSLEAFKDRLGDASNSWRKLVVYRDPMERFLSAYRSKCLLADGDRDGRMHCHDLFRLNDSQISVLNVANRLAKYGHHNPHWATQSSFCGGTVGSMWTSYTHHVSFNNLSGIAHAFKGRVSPKTFEKIRIQLSPPASGGHITDAKGHVQADLGSAEVRRKLYDFYAKDYSLPPLRNSLLSDILDSIGK